MKTKKLQLKKEVIAALNNDAMSHVLGGDLVGNTPDCIHPSAGGGCGSGICVQITKSPKNCAMTKWDTCVCVIPDTKYCVVKTDDCILSDFCIAKTDTCP